MKREPLSTEIKRFAQKTQTLRERIVDMIRTAIVKGELQPGERISEQSLAERFGISRTPIREAIRQLDSEGFLTVIPRRGAIVTPITERDIKEFYAIKGLIEGYAARIAVEHLTDSEIERMEALNEELGKFASEGKIRKMFRAHNEFHDIFVRACGNEKLHQITKNLIQQFQRFRIVLSIFGGISQSVEQHRRIIDAFKRRDAVEVERLVSENARSGGELLIREILEKRVGMKGDTGE